MHLTLKAILAAPVLSLSMLASAQELPPIQPAPAPETAPVNVDPPSPAFPPPPTSFGRPPRPKGNPGLWITQNDYPPASRKAKHSGWVSFRLIIGPQGQISDCQIIVSSTYAELDEATCRLIRERGRFVPAQDSEGKPITGSWSSRVRWIMD